MPLVIVPLSLWHEVTTKPRDSVAEAKHMDEGKKVTVFYSCLTRACFAKEALRRFTFAFNVVPQWLVWLSSDTAGLSSVLGTPAPLPSWPIHSLMGPFWSYRHTAGQDLE